MNELIDGVRIEGEIIVDGQNIYDPLVDVVELRKRIGMIFQKSNPFPKTIYENVAFGLRIGGFGKKSKSDIDEIVERS